MGKRKKHKYKESKLYWHEALDRSHIARDHFYEYVLQHPAVSNNKELSLHAEKIMETMGNFYQLVGAKYHEFESNKK